MCVRERRGAGVCGEPPIEHRAVMLRAPIEHRAVMLITPIENRAVMLRSSYRAQGCNAEVLL